MFKLIDVWTYGKHVTRNLESKSRIPLECIIYDNVLIEIAKLFIVRFHIRNINGRKKDKYDII